MDLTLSLVSQIGNLSGGSDLAFEEVTEEGNEYFIKAHKDGWFMLSPSGNQ